MSNVDDQARNQLLSSVNSLCEDLQEYGSRVFTHDDEDEDGADIPEPLDVTVHISLSGDYRGANILFTFGGPTIYAVTNGDGSGTVYGSWGTDSFSRPFDADEELDEFISEIWQVGN